MKRTFVLMALFAVLNLVGCATQTYEEAIIEDRDRELKRIDDLTK
jgi:hypothetical protein